MPEVYSYLFDGSDLEITSLSVFVAILYMQVVYIFGMILYVLRSHNSDNYSLI